MYNALEAVHADLKGLENTLRTPAAAARVARIAEALEQCAQDVSDATRQATGGRRSRRAAEGLSGAWLPRAGSCCACTNCRAWTKAVCSEVVAGSSTV